MPPLVSVIVPIYNADRYLTECLESISRQSLRDIEIVLIDDGSDDNSNRICKEYCEREPRARLFRQENGGIASARNAGLAAATGEYVAFVDSDDIVLQDGIERLHEVAASKGCDMVVGGYETLQAERRRRVVQPPVHSQEGFLVALLEGRAHSALWNKLIRRNALSGISFEEGVDYMEDRLLLTKLLLGRKLVICSIEEPVYLYRQHEGAVTASTDDRLFRVFKAQRSVAVTVQSMGGSLSIKAAFRKSAAHSLWFVFRRARREMDEALLHEMKGYIYDLKRIGLRPYAEIKPSGLLLLILALPKRLALIGIASLRRLISVHRSQPADDQKQSRNQLGLA